MTIELAIIVVLLAMASFAIYQWDVWKRRAELHYNKAVEMANTIVQINNVLGVEIARRETEQIRAGGTD